MAVCALSFLKMVFTVVQKMIQQERTHVKKQLEFSSLEHSNHISEATQLAHLVQHSIVFFACHMIENISCWELQFNLFVSTFNGNSNKPSHLSVCTMHETIHFYNSRKKVSENQALYSHFNAIETN
jgi:hypothetical protein